MQAIPAAASRWVVHGEMQVVPAQEPLKSTLGFLAPTLFPGDTVGLETGRDHCLSFDGLLIEAGAFAAVRVEAIGSYGDEVPALSICVLQAGQPG